MESVLPKSSRHWTFVSKLYEREGTSIGNYMRMREGEEQRREGGRKGGGVTGRKGMRKREREREGGEGGFGQSSSSTEWLHTIPWWLFFQCHKGSRHIWMWGTGPRLEWREKCSVLQQSVWMWVLSLEPVRESNCDDGEEESWYIWYYNILASRLGVKGLQWIHTNGTCCGHTPKKYLHAPMIPYHHKHNSLVSSVWPQHVHVPSAEEDLHGLNIWPFLCQTAVLCSLGIIW